MKPFKKIILRAIVCVLAIATCVGVTGCFFSTKDKGLSKEEKALRANAVEVLNYMIVDATRVESIYDEDVDEEHIEGYVFYDDQYQIIKKMLNDESVKLGDYYSVEIVAEDELEKVVFVYSVDVTSNKIIVKSEYAEYSRESLTEDYAIEEVKKGYYIINYVKEKPISLTAYSSDTENVYDYEYFKLATENTKIFDTYECMYKNSNNPDSIIFYYEYVEGEEYLSLNGSAINGIGLIYCNNIIDDMKEKIDTISYKNASVMPQAIEELVIEIAEKI